MCRDRSSTAKGAPGEATMVDWYGGTGGKPPTAARVGKGGGKHHALRKGSGRMLTGGMKKRLTCRGSGSTTVNGHAKKQRRDMQDHEGRIKRSRPFQQSISCKLNERDGKGLVKS